MSQTIPLNTNTKYDILDIELCDINNPLILNGNVNVNVDVNTNTNTNNINANTCPLNNEDKCYICLCPLENNIQTLSCYPQHQIHKECFEQNMLNNIFACGLCKKQLHITETEYEHLKNKYLESHSNNLKKTKIFKFFDYIYEINMTYSTYKFISKIYNILNSVFIILVSMMVSLTVLHLVLMTDNDNRNSNEQNKYNKYYGTFTDVYSELNEVVFVYSYANDLNLNSNLNNTKLCIDIQMYDNLQEANKTVVNMKSNIGENMNIYVKKAETYSCVLFIDLFNSNIIFENIFLIFFFVNFLLILLLIHIKYIVIENEEVFSTVDEIDLNFLNSLRSIVKQ